MVELVELVDYMVGGVYAWTVCGMLFPFHLVLIAGVIYYLGYLQGKNHHG